MNLKYSWYDRSNFSSATSSSSSSSSLAFFPGRFFSGTSSSSGSSHSSKPTSCAMVTTGWISVLFSRTSFISRRGRTGCSTSLAGEAAAEVAVALTSTSMTSVSAGVDSAVTTTATSVALALAAADIFSSSQRASSSSACLSAIRSTECNFRRRARSFEDPRSRRDAMESCLERTAGSESAGMLCTDSNKSSSRSSFLLLVCFHITPSSLE